MCLAFSLKALPQTMCLLLVISWSIVRKNGPRVPSRLHIRRILFSCHWLARARLEAMEQNNTPPTYQPEIPMMPRLVGPWHVLFGWNMPQTCCNVKNHWWTLTDPTNPIGCRSVSRSGRENSWALAISPFSLHDLEMQVQLSLHWVSLWNLFKWCSNQ